MASVRPGTGALALACAAVLLGGCADLREPAELPVAAEGVPPAAAAETIEPRPPGCPEPLPDGLGPEGRAALEGTCLLPEVFTRFGGPGYMGGGLIDPHVSSDIFIYWHGELDAATQALIDEAAADGIHVEVRPVPYSEAEMMAASTVVHQALEARGIVVLIIAPSFEHIVVTVADTADPDAAQAAVDAATDIPVTIELADPSDVVVLY